MDKVSKKDFEKYLGEAQGWEIDKIIELKKSRKIAWWISAIAICMAFLSTLAVTVLTPLKTVQPYVIRVDNTSGIVEVIDSLKNGKTMYEEVINRYFAQLYVRYREGYSRELASEYYTNVGLMSAGQEQQKFANYFNPKNPSSPLNEYGEYKKVSVKIFGTTFIKPEIALVRYAKLVEERGSSKVQSTHYTATIIFKYIGKTNMSEENRAINPLGFQVVEYRNDPDSAPQEILLPEIEKGVKQ
ncbi:virB8 family protein [Desulfopila sp. IMCC35006]|uniref:virB8 family protein n=1 Tax=Desulfopila sp. IMCC35006 TaxID=2569542 RepID=UPI0010AC5832|nr:VirB8/TrbF family protein [Desulfopila sp. IMCC35006]TKB23476.1 virB8 family protein [Desulfopila sp. IMCC35006]